MLSYQIVSQNEAYNNFFKLLEKIEESRQVYIVNRDNGENIALIAESDLKSLVETVFLLRSPKNAIRLMEAIEESKTGKIKPQSIEDLKQELAIEQDDEL
ncbi:hypothetical protein RIVM261_059040 [Rivularia sp. IAM M-261]|nr:hypothetical protein CAL7716_034060 [Calothrix sp. PCC 7716]GJD20948.1 hypothetical protein RIVM261_059040 [Rivularia sp. IAM M-261]